MHKTEVVILFEGLFNLLSDVVLFSSYIGAKSTFPRPLSPEKEREYLLKAKDGDQDAKDVLIKHNLRLVVHIVKKYNNYNDVDELISVGSIGLIKAINTYEMGKGTQLVTYAARCIENEILMTLRANKKLKSNVSIDAPMGTDKDGNEISLIDVLCSEEDCIFDSVEHSMLSDKLFELVKNVLDEREYRTIVLRYGLNGSPALTQREVAKLFGISRSYVSRIEKRALNKIKVNIDREELFI